MLEQQVSFYRKETGISRIEAELFRKALACAGGCPEHLEKREEELQKEEKRLCDLRSKLMEVK